MTGMCFQPRSSLKDGTSQSGVIQSKCATKIRQIALNFAQSVIQLITYKNHVEHWSYFVTNTVRKKPPIKKKIRGLHLSVNIFQPNNIWISGPLPSGWNFTSGCLNPCHAKSLFYLSVGYLLSCLYVSRRNWKILSATEDHGFPPHTHTHRPHRAALNPPLRCHVWRNKDTSL